MLVTSNFSFSHNIFHSYISLVRQNVALCGNGLNMYLDLLWTRYVGEKVLKSKKRCQSAGNIMNIDSAMIEGQL